MNPTARRSWMKAVLAILTVPATTRLQMAPAKHPSEMDKTIIPQLSAPKTRQYHEPPLNVDYADNASVFGAILRGETRSLTLKETTNILAFQDRSPRAPLHALVIPKKRIKNVFDLEQKDLPWVEEVHDVATDLLRAYQPDALLSNDYILCYHVPPFNSVDHLHLHVLAPASKMHWLFRFTKYLPGTRWCIGGEQVLQRLKDGKKAVPFRRGGS